MEKAFQGLAEAMIEEIDLRVPSEDFSAESFRSLEDFERAKALLRVLVEIVDKYTEKARRLAE